MWIGTVKGLITKRIDHIPSAQKLAWRALWFAFLCTIELILVIAVCVAVPLSVDIRNLAQDYDMLRAAMVDDLGEVGPHLSSIRENMVRFDRHMAVPSFVASHMGWVPRYGPTLEIAPRFIDLAHHGIAVADETWQLLSQSGAWAVLQGSNSDASSPWPQLIVQADWSAWMEASSAFKADLVWLETLEADGLHPALASKMDLAQSASDLMALSLDLFEPGCRWLAATPEQHLLLLAQNNDELRATGGFLSSIGELTISQGLPIIGQMGDSYRVEDWSKPHPDPPQALRDYMELDLWVTRDGNWWPDFPTSAQAVADLYALNQDQLIDGVVAVDMIAVEAFVEEMTPPQLADGSRLESGDVGAMFREGWGLPMDQLTNAGVMITATQAFSDVEVILTYSDQTGEAWFDSLTLVDPMSPERNLISNGSFEEPLGDVSTVPAWRVNGLESTDGVVDGIAHTGGQSLHLLGQQGVTKEVWQSLGVSGEAGQVFRLSGQSRAASASMIGPQAKYAVAVVLVGAEGSKRQVEGFPGLTHDWASSGTASILADWWRHRKDAAFEAAMAAFAKMTKNPRNVPWQDLLPLVRQLVDQKHIQAYVVNPDIQQVLSEHGWDGALTDITDDYMLIVDSNVGYNKVSASVEQSIAYEVDLRAQPPRARLTIHYENTSEGSVVECDKHAQYVPSYEMMSQGCYWDYVRIYVPQGCSLIDSRGGDEPIQTSFESGRMVMSTSLVLLPGEQRDLEIEYVLADSMLSDGQYDLYVQKQAGTVAIPLSLQILTSGRPVSVSSNVEWYGDEDGLYSTTDLLVDRYWSVAFNRSTEIK